MTNDPFTRCTIETVYLKNQPQYTDLCETKVEISILNMVLKISINIEKYTQR